MPLEHRLLQICCCASTGSASHTMMCKFVTTESMHLRNSFHIQTNVRTQNLIGFAKITWLNVYFDWRCLNFLHWYLLFEKVLGVLLKLFIFCLHVLTQLLHDL
jgi:hypothetical protein